MQEVGSHTQGGDRQYLDADWGSTALLGEHHAAGLAG